MIELQQDDPPLACWKPDVPVRIRRELKHVEDKEALKRYGLGDRHKTVTHRDGCSVSLSSLPSSFLSVRAPVVLSLDLPWPVLLGRSAFSGEVAALDVFVFLVLRAQCFSRRVHKGGFVSVSFDQVAAVLGWRKARDAMATARACGIVRTDCAWRRPASGPGYEHAGKAIGYQLTEAALSWGFVVKRMHAKPAKAFAQRRRAMAAKVSANPSHRAIFAALRKVTLDESVLPGLLNPPSGEPLLKSVHRIMAAMAIVRKEWFFIEDEKTGRVFHNVANLHKETRRHLLLSGKPTIQIDVGNCQPTLLCANVYGEKPGLEREMMLGLVQSRQFYPTICTWAGMSGRSYADAKDAVFKGLLFADRYPNEGMAAAIEKNAPIMAAYIRDCRAKAGNWLALALQTKEAEVMLQGVTARLRAAGIESVSVHDAVLVASDNAMEAREIVAAVFAEMTGISPSLHVESALQMETIDKEATERKAGVLDVRAITPTPTDTETSSPPDTNHTTRATVDPAPPLLRTPCPADLCPGCWALNRAVLLHSAFGCEHQAPRHECREA